VRIIDLFAGLGGFHEAAKQLGATCVFACEINEKLCALYEGNFGVRPAGDIRSVAPKEVPEHDILCAGFPCQPFSKAGDQMGWEDSAPGTVFFKLIDILRVHRPTLLLLENVAHFVRHDAGNTYRKVRRELEKLGYDVQHCQLSPHQFGVPQVRERMYMVGRLGILGDFEWPAIQTRAEELSIRMVLDKHPEDAKPIGEKTIECLEIWQEFLRTFPAEVFVPSFPIWSMEFRATYPDRCDSLYEIELSRLRRSRGSFGCSLDTWFRRDILSRVPSHARAEEGAFPRWKQQFIRLNRRLYRENADWLGSWIPKIKRYCPSFQKLEWNCHGEERDIWKYVIQFRASGVRVKRPTTSPSLVAMTTTQVPIIGWERRYMTLRECARLQSMGDLKHLPKGGLGMKALGNAVNVRVVRLILEQLVACKSRGCSRAS